MGIKIALDSESVFYYLTNRPAEQSHDGRKQPDITTLFRPIVTASLGKAELPLPLQGIGIHFRGMGNRRYSGQAIIQSRRAISLPRLSTRLQEAFPVESGYQCAPIRPSGLESYVYERKSKEVAFAVDYTTNPQSGKPAFLVLMGCNGAKMRALDSEAAFIEELDAFGDITSRFLETCFSSPRKTHALPNSVVIPPRLEFSLVGVEYGS